MLFNLLIGLAIQAPAPEPDPAALAAFLAGEQRYAERLGVVMQKDLGRDWARYLDDEQERAEERAEGEEGPDVAVQRFGDYLEDRHRKRLTPGILLLSIGFAPLGVGLYIGLALGDEGEVGFGIAGLGAAAIVTGAALLGVRIMQRQRFRQARASLDARGPRARLRWRGLAPMWDPQRRTHGASVGFAF